MNDLFGHYGYLNIYYISDSWNYSHVDHIFYPYLYTYIQICRIIYGSKIFKITVRINFILNYMDNGLQVADVILIGHSTFNMQYIIPAIDSKHLKFFMEDSWRRMMKNRLAM